ncbi:MAG TPA: MerR family transcriptional regulator [Pseudonocardiaceae bacterium]|jgi:DNA-binding transcriptional MerR regulator|nr:MerR family transcriptional regulator [Pseudonocardiaceae bacterium]
MVQVKGTRVLTIGQLAQSCGVPTSTIRFWERRGLLAPDARQSGQRRYDERARVEVALLKLCQDAGFTLAEIGRFAEHRNSGRLIWRDMVKDKILDVEENLRRLHKAHDMLGHALNCPHEDITECPLFQEAVGHRLGPGGPTPEQTASQD